MGEMPKPRELHERAGQAAKATRETMIKLTTASVGVLAFISTRNIDPALDTYDKVFLLVSVLFVVGSLSSAVWFGFAEAQWAYWWAVHLDPDHKDQPKGSKNRDWWHKQKSLSEKAMLILFVFAGLCMGLFLVSRVLKLGPVV
jgi:uncharacterized membrane protein